MTLPIHQPVSPPGPPSRVRYLVLFWLCVATTIAYIDRGCISVVEKTIRADLDLTDGDMGWIMGGFFFAYAIFQLPSGWLGHLWGTRRSLPVFSVLWSAATGLCALAGGGTLLLLGRLAMGAAEAGIFPCATHTLAKWFPVSRRAWACGVLGSFMGVGGALGAALSGLLLQTMSWRWLFTLYAVPGIFWSAWFFFWFRNTPREHQAVNAAERDLIDPFSTASQPEAQSRERTPWKTIFTTWAMWCLCGQHLFRAAVVVFYASWFPTFLQDARGLSRLDAGLLSSYPFWASVLGSVAGGMLSDGILARTHSRRLSRQGLAIGSMVGGALLALWASRVDNVYLAVWAFSGGSFIASFAGPCAYAATIDMGGNQVAPVFSTMNLAGSVGAWLFPIVVPELVRSSGWDGVLFVFTAMHLAAAVCWMLFNPNSSIVGGHEASKE